MPDRPRPEDVHLVVCTCPDQPTAESLAEALVGERLAACVNILPGILSIYRWQDVVKRDNEILLLIKTTETRVAALTTRIEELHPYEVPEVISHPIVAGHDSYLEWVRQCTAHNT